jgi:transposase
MLGLVTTQDGDVPVGLQALDGNASDHVSLPALVRAVLTQLGDAGAAKEPEEEPLFVADSALYSTTTRQHFSAAQVQWVSRVPETSTEAKAAVAEAVEAATTAAGWQTTDDQAVHWLRLSATRSPDTERWLVVRTSAGQERARATLTRQVAVQQEAWQRTLWHLGNRDFACEPDAQAALTRALRDLPDWLQVESQVVAQPRYTRKGRPRKDVPPDHRVWRIEIQVTVAVDAVEREALRRACFLVATNVLDVVALPDETLIRIYTQDQGGVERGCAFLKDPLFLATSVFLKKPERIVALSCVMVLCLLVYRLAEHRLRQQLAATGQTIPSQLNKPTVRPTMRWVFQCFKGLDRLTVVTLTGVQVLVLHLTPLHEQILSLLGQSYRAIYQLTT